MVTRLAALAEAQSGKPVLKLHCTSELNVLSVQMTKGSEDIFGVTTPEVEVQVGGAKTVNSEGAVGSTVCVEEAVSAKVHDEGWMETGLEEGVGLSVAAGRANPNTSPSVAADMSEVVTIAMSVTKGASEFSHKSTPCSTPLISRFAYSFLRTFANMLASGFLFLAGG